MRSGRKEEKEMGKNLLARKQFMEICKAVFDFEEYGIKPKLKDIKLHSGRRSLSYYFEDLDENEYKISFSYDGYSEFYIFVYLTISFNRYKEVSHVHFNLSYSNGLMCLVYRSGCHFLKKAYELGDLVSKKEGRICDSLQ